MNWLPLNTFAPESEEIFILSAIAEKYDLIPKERSMPAGIINTARTIKFLVKVFFIRLNPLLKISPSVIG